MTKLTSLEWEVLNATADDWESLEQIHEIVRQAPGTGNGKHVALSQTADAVHTLVSQGLLLCRDESGANVTDVGDLSYVWRGWFAMSDEGRKHWQASAAGRNRPRRSTAAKHR